MADQGLIPNLQMGAPFRAALEGDLKVYGEVKTRAKLTLE